MLERTKAKKRYVEQRKLPEIKTETWTPAMPVLMRLHMWP